MTNLIDVPQHEADYAELRIVGGGAPMSARQIQIREKQAIATHKIGQTTQMNCKTTPA